jgi:hypothetical protein
MCQRLVLRRLLPRRLVGPAVSVAKRLARSAARGAVLASVEAVRGQGHLAHLWRFQEAAQLADGTAVGAYSLPLLAASQYVQLRSPQWPATPQDVCFAAAPLQSEPHLTGDVICHFTSLAPRMRLRSMHAPLGAMPRCAPPATCWR